jgi:hypothetical protein
MAAPKKPTPKKSADRLAAAASGDRQSILPFRKKP